MLARFAGFSQLVMAGLALAWSAEPGWTAPEQDRAALITLYRTKFPGLPLQDYVDGALMLSRDAKTQFEAIMDFPPFQGDIDAGRTLWETRFKNGKKFADCFPDAGRNVAGRYPYYSASIDKVVTFEMDINRCLRDNGEPPYGFGDRSMGILTAYARTLSDGMPVDVRIDSAGALAKYEQGKKLYYTRMGQYNFSCASCHVVLAGRILRTEILSPAIGQTTHWPVFRGGEHLTTLQMRYAQCMEQMHAAPLAAGSEQFNNLEYFHSYLSNGLPMRASVYRK